MSRSFILCHVLVALLAQGLAALAAAQPAATSEAPTAPPPPTGPLNYQQLLARRPYDLITLTAAHNNEVHAVEPIALPNREVPENPKPSDKLVVKRLAVDGDFEIRWFDIERIELFEDILLREANQLVAAGKLDEAFDYFRFLRDIYPRTKGLPAAHQTYLYQCVADARQRNAYSEALAIAEELHNHNASFRESVNSPPLTDEIGQIADQLLDGYVKQDDFGNAKTLLKRLQSRYGANTAFVRSWRQRFSDIAARHRDAARAHLAAGRFVEAYDACAQMSSVWPDVEGGAELSAEIARAYPLVIVGVGQPFLSYEARSLANHAARRTGRLLERRLMEFAGLGPEGGTYRCSLGSFEQSDDRLRLTIKTAAPSHADGRSGYSGFDLAQHLLELADPASSDYQPQWARLLDRVEVVRVRDVHADLKVPHVLPQALLQTSFDQVAGVGEPGVKGSGPYFILSKTDNVVRFTQNDQYASSTRGQPAEIMERYYDDAKRGILALQRGEVDVLDQVFPGDVPELQASEGVSVGRCSVPTIHFLKVNRRHPYLTSRTFRRALVYGCDRPGILAKSLLKLPPGGTPPPGYRVTSAPFPAAVNASDSTAYGYDESVRPRSFNPWLAMVLKVVASNDLKSQFEQQRKQAPPLTPLTLGHPADEISRIACRALAQQWKVIGIETKLVEFPPGVALDVQDECDLVYVQAATWEPVVDAGRLLAPGGLAPADNTYVSLMLRRVESARDWVEARQALRDLHRQLHEDVAIIPLWQTFDYYAWRRSVQGIADGQASLYETVDRWQVAPRLAGK